MAYSIENLLGFLNLGIVIANGKGNDRVEIPKDVAIEIVANLETLKAMIDTINEEP